jgi:hypothetical protein
MIREDFFTGEPVETGSPSLDETDAANMASFGSYSYDPAQRQQMMLSAPYNSGQFPQQNVGIGYNPYMQPGGYQYQGYYNPYYQGYNPYYQNPYYQQQQPQYGYQQPEYIEYKIEPLQPSSEYLPEVGYEDTINEMQRHYMTKEIEVQAEQAVERNRSGYGNAYGTNYYGYPHFYNPYAYNQVNIELQAEIDRMKEEARERRFNFNFRLSRLAHNIARDGISDEAITERYTGKTIVEKNKTVVGEVKVQYDAMRFENMVPFNNAQMYRDHDAQISREFHEIIPEDSDLDSFLKNIGVLKAHMMMEEEKHRRKNSSVLYNHDGNTYKMFVAEQAARRYRERKGYSEINTDVSSPPIPSTIFPTLSQSARLSDDGTLNITCNFGSQKGKSYNVNENKYEEKRAQFASFLQSIPGSIYTEERGANDGR